MIDSSPDEILDSLVKLSSPALRAEVAAMINGMLEIWEHRRQAESDVLSVTYFVMGRQRCTMITRDVPDFPIPVPLGKMSFYVDRTEQPELVCRPSSGYVDDFAPRGSVYLGLNDTTFVRLHDRRDYIEVSFLRAQDRNWVRVELNGQPWRLSTDALFVRRSIAGDA